MFLVFPAAQMTAHHLCNRGGAVLSPRSHSAVTGRRGPRRPLGRCCSSQDVRAMKGLDRMEGFRSYEKDLFHVEADCKLSGLGSWVHGKNIN